MASHTILASHTLDSAVTQITEEPAMSRTTSLCFNGHQMSMKDNFCQFCGAPVARVAAPPQKSKIGKVLTWSLLAGFVLLSILFLVPPSNIDEPLPVTGMSQEEAEDFVELAIQTAYDIGVDNAMQIRPQIAAIIADSNITYTDVQSEIEKACNTDAEQMRTLAIQIFDNTLPDSVLKLMTNAYIDGCVNTIASVFTEGTSDNSKMMPSSDANTSDQSEIKIDLEGYCNDLVVNSTSELGSQEDNAPPEALIMSTIQTCVSGITEEIGAENLNSPELPQILVWICEGALSSNPDLCPAIVEANTEKPKPVSSNIASHSEAPSQLGKEGQTVTFSVNGSSEGRPYLTWYWPGGYEMNDEYGDNAKYSTLPFEFEFTLLRDLDDWEEISVYADPNGPGPVTCRISIDNVAVATESSSDDPYSTNGNVLCSWSRGLN